MKTPRLLYRLHGLITTRMFSREPPRLYAFERITLAAVRGLLDWFEMREMYGGCEKEREVFERNYERLDNELRRIRERFGIT